MLWRSAVQWTQIKLLASRHSQIQCAQVSLAILEYQRAKGHDLTWDPQQPAAGAWCELCQPSLVCALSATVCHSQSSSATCWKNPGQIWGLALPGCCTQIQRGAGPHHGHKAVLDAPPNSTWVYLGMSQSCQRAPDCQNTEGLKDITLSPPDSQLHHN